MKKARIIIAVAMAIVLCIPLAMLSSASAKDGSYTITNQYANVDWDAVTPYKTALHTHTNASDGHDTLRQSVGRQAEHGFDIIATTDHGTVNYSWEYENVNPLVFSAMGLIGKTDGKLDYLGKSGEFPDGTAYTLDKNSSGDEILHLENGRDILRLPYGNEHNAVSANAHVQTWFVDYTDNSVTTYEETIKALDKRDCGISIINHPGEYTKAKEEIRSDSAYSESNLTYRYYINKFANLIEKYDSCKGIDINSKGDSRTRFDRILWDNLLKRFAANGETVYAIASSDAHNLGVTNSGFSMLLMEKFDSAEAKRVLEAGEFFPASHNIGNIDELIDIAAGVKEFYGETDIYNKLTSTINAMDERIKGIENGKYDADDRIGIEYQTTDDNGYALYDTDPMITKITVNEDTDEITLDTKDALIVRWISDGKLVCTQKADAATIDLNDYASKLGDYVRAEVFGEGGILYTQAFILNAEENAGKANPVDKGYMNLGFFDFMFAIINNWKDVMTRSVSNIFGSK